MLQSKVFWDYFMVTGNIGAYLIFREIDQDKLQMYKLAEKSNTSKRVR
jgi:hypothetical protein